MVKTTVNLDDDLWKKFSIKVIEQYGGRKKTDVFEALAEAFVSAPHKTIEQALEDWIRAHERKRSKSRS